MAALFAMTSASAQDNDNDKRFFNHLAVGVSAATTGIGVDVAMPICNYVDVRAGLSVFPKIKADADLDLGFNGGDYSGYNIPDEIEAEVKTGFTNGKILFDLYPGKSSIFHITVGAFFGSSQIVEVYNKEDGALKSIYDFNKAYPSQKIGVELGDYFLEPDAQGNMNACIKTASFKPYVGIGFGRSVPRKNRLGFSFEMGCQFWGSPKVYCNGEELSDEKLDSDSGDIAKVLSKITVYPVISFRLSGRIF